MTFPFCKLQHCVFFLIQCSSLVFYLFPYFILVMSKKHRFPLVLILHVQKWLLFAHVNLNSFLFFLFRSLCTSVIHILHHDAFRWYSLPLRRAVLSKTEITEVLFHNGCTVYAPPRQRPPGYGVSSLRFHMARIRTRRTSCNRQVSACRTWRRRCNPSGELSGECSYYLPFSIDSIARNISYITCGTIALPYAFIDSCRHFEKAIPSNPVKIPSSRLQTGD